MVKIGNISLEDFPLLLAPMEDVSDPPFRALCKENGADIHSAPIKSHKLNIVGNSHHRFGQYLVDKDEK